MILLLRGEKRAKRQKTSKSSKSSKSARSSSSKQPTSTYVFKCQQQQQDWDAWTEPQVTDEDEVILEDTTPELIDEFQNADKHIPTIYDYARMMATPNDVMSNQFKDAEKNPNEPPRYLYNKDLFFLRYGKTEERIYILSLHKIHVVPFPEDDLE
ncbi:hypothetical protein Tco_0399993 [Tanacetum coccineum]